MGIDADLDERRREPRVRAFVFSWFEAEDHSAFGPIENISGGGMFLRTAIDAIVGSAGRFRLLLAPGSNVTGSARVAWRRQDNQIPSGVGLIFEEIEEGKEALERFLGERLGGRAGDPGTAAS